MSHDATPSTPAPTDAAPAPAPAPTPAAPRSADLVLAGLHLRLGSLALARAELETLAGRDALDEAGIVDLAEARWRTGDVTGAGEAAAVVVQGEDGPLVALVIAAEAAMALGRPSEARRLATRAMTAAGGSIDVVFGGMPRAAVWPADPLLLPPEPVSLFDVPSSTAAAATAAAEASTAGAGALVGAASIGPDSGAGPSADRTGEPPAAGALDLVTIGIWDEPDGAPAPPSAAPAAGAAEAPAALPPAGESLEQGRAALARGDTAGAAVRFALVLRIAPELAPVVLESVADDRSPGLAFVRGDAYRLVGREAEARQAFAVAVAATTATSHTPSEPEPEPDLDLPPPEGAPA